MLSRALLQQQRNSSLLSSMRQSCYFSTAMRSKVVGDAIFMPEMFPAKLVVPTAKSNYEFTMNNQLTLAQFEDKVLANSESQVKKFNLKSLETCEDQTGSMTLGELKKERFQMSINGKSYTVYPDFRSLIDSESQEKGCDLDSSISISRQVVLKDFYESMVAQMRAKADKDGQLTREQFDTAMKQAIAEYKKHVDSEDYLRQAFASLQTSKNDLERLKKEKASLIKRAHMRAGMLLGAGFAGCITQLVGFTLGIYYIYDWNEMEPWTWIVQSFYLAIGSYYYLYTRSDWDHTKVYISMYQRAVRKFAEREKFDMEKVEALENYVADLESNLRLLNNDQRVDDLGQKQQ